MGYYLRALFRITLNIGALWFILFIPHSSFGETGNYIQNAIPQFYVSLIVSVVILHIFLKFRPNDDRIIWWKYTKFVFLYGPLLMVLNGLTLYFHDHGEAYNQTDKFSLFLDYVLVTAYLGGSILLILKHDSLLRVGSMSFSIRRILPYYLILVIIYFLAQVLLYKNMVPIQQLDTDTYKVVDLIKKLFYTSIFLLWLLITFIVLYFLPNKFFKKWWSFAKNGIPLTFAFLYVLSLRYHYTHGGWFGDFNQLTDIVLFSFVMFVFTSGSLIQIIRGYYQK